VLSGGRLEIQPLSTRIGGGAMNGNVTLDASTGKTATLAAKIDAKAMDLGQVLRQMGHAEMVTGAKTDVAMSLRGSGGTVRELMAGLNPTEVAQAMDLVAAIGERGTTVLIIEHVMKAIMGICGRIIVLHHGEKIAEGTPQEIATSRTVIEVYLGE